MNNPYVKDTLEFRQIVLKHIQRILEISSSELRNKTIRRLHTEYSEVIKDEDTRISYIQAIENLAYVLIPYFDEQVSKVYHECEPIMNAFYFEIKKLLKKEYEFAKAETGREDLGKDFVIEMKLKYAKKLFIALNLLLKRNDYLRSSVYGEERDELVQEED